MHSLATRLDQKFPAANGTGFTFMTAQGALMRKNPLGPIIGTTIVVKHL